MGSQPSNVPIVENDCSVGGPGSISVVIGFRGGVQCHICSNLLGGKCWESGIPSSRGAFLRSDVELELEPEHFPRTRGSRDILLGAEVRAEAVVLSLAQK